MDIHEKRFDLDDSQSWATADNGNFDQDLKLENVSEAADHGVIRLRLGLFPGMRDLLANDLDYLVEKAAELSMEESMEILQLALEQHYDDINYQQDSLARIQSLILGDGAYALGRNLFEIDIKLEACMIKFYSPYP